jgi:hypothetical protein
VNGTCYVALQMVGHRVCICIIPIITLVFLQYYSSILFKFQFPMHLFGMTAQCFDSSVLMNLTEPRSVERWGLCHSTLAIRSYHEVEESECDFKRDRLLQCRT